MKENGARKVIKPGLCLTRHYGESVVIFVGDEEIEVIVEKTHNPGSTAILRVLAPKKFDIVRTELLEEYDD
jgi:sRNA-binding carbon storage regulator CsrA